MKKRFCETLKIFSFSLSFWSFEFGFFLKREHRKRRGINMDDDLDANEEVNFYFFYVFKFFLLSGEKQEFTVCFSRTFSFQRTNAHHKTNKQNSGSSIRKIL